MNFPLIIKACVGIISFLYGSLLLHDVAHEIMEKDMALNVFILKKLYNK